MRKYLLIIFIIVFQTGCVSVKYLQYTNSDVQIGSGGSIETRNGVDFWENGNPDFEYKIIGVIEYKANDAPVQNMMMKNKIANKVIEKGGDGVILFNEEIRNKGTYSRGTAKGAYGGGIAMSGTSVNLSKKRAKYYVIKYMN